MDIYEIRKELSSGKVISDLPLRVTYYARVSTDKEEQLHSLSAQVTYYDDFIQNCPNWTRVNGYIDEGISGTSVRKRENFLRMIDDARDHKFDFIITKEISRFSRSTLDSIQYTQELLRCGVGVLFQSDNINTLLPDSELRLTIMASVAQEEVRKISERVRFGFQRAIEKGVVLGSNRIWGYQKQAGRLVIKEDEAEMVRMIFDLYANALMGIRAIAACLTEKGYRNTNGNPFSFSTIRGILSNPKYKGYYCGSKTTRIDYKLNTIKSFSPEEWITYKDHENVPPIVSEELWNKANLILNKRSERQKMTNQTGYQNKYPYSGKIFCGIHHISYYRSLYRYKTGNKEVWQCQKYVKNGKESCKTPVLYTYEIESVLRQLMEQIFPRSEELLLKLIQIYSTMDQTGKIAEAVLKCRSKIKDIMNRKDKLLDLSIEGKISDEELEIRNDRFNRELEEQKSRLKQMEEQKRRSLEAMQSMNRLNASIRYELSFPDGFTIGVVDALLDHMDVFAANGKNLIEIDVYLHITQEHQKYSIFRQRGKPSECSRVYI